jgi:hypothetical protein
MVKNNHVSGTLEPLIIGLTLISIRGQPKTRNRGFNLRIGHKPPTQTNSPLTVVVDMNSF